MMANISSSSSNATTSSNSSNAATTTDNNNNSTKGQQQQQQQEYYNNIATKLGEGIEIKDRKWYAKTYRQCFLHSEAVQYIQRHYQKDEVKAVELLNQLQHYGYLQHVVDPYKKFKVGQKQKLYFRLFVQKANKTRTNNNNNNMGTKEMINNNNNNNKDEKKEELNHNNNEQQQQQQQLSSLQQGKWNRISASVTQLTDTQRMIETKLEIVHQCVISIIQTMVSIALLLLILLIYTLFVIVPTLRRDIEQPQNNNIHNHNNIFLGTATIVTFLLGAIAFIIQGRNLFSIWLALDTSVIQATEGKDAVEDYEMRMSDDDNNNNNNRNKNISKKASGTTSTTAPATTTTTTVGLSTRRQSSIVLKEPTMMRETSSQLLQQRNSSILQQRQASDLPDPSTWPHRPILVCANTPVSSSLTIEPTHNNNGPCPIGIPFHFSSDLFVGQCLIRIKNVPNSNNSMGDKIYFDGRRRIFQTIIQGRFKEPLRVSDVLTGHEFIRPLENLPHPWIIKAATNVIGKLAPGATIQVMGDTPTMLASLAATSQIVRGDEPGNEPNIACCSNTTTMNDEDNSINNNEDNDIQEDCSMLGGKFATSKVSSMGRKLHLANPERAAQYTYDTETIYTFDFYQSLLNVGTYSLDMGIANIHIAPILNGQPIQCLCKTIDGRYLWSFQIWHENLLPQSSSSSGSSSSYDDERDKKRKTC